MRMAWVAPSVVKTRLQWVQPGGAVGGEPVRDRPVAEHVAVAVLGDQLADSDDDAEDQDPGHDDPGGDPAPVMPGGAAGPATCAGFRLGRLEVGAGLGFQSLGDRIGHRLAGRAAAQLEGQGRDPEPGDADRPGAHDVGQVMHAEQDPADPDQGDERDDHGDERGPPPAAGGGQEDQQDRAVADDRTERVAAGEAVPGAVGDRMRHHGAQPADQRLEDGIQGQRARAGDEQVGGQPPAPPDGQDDRRGRDHGPQHAVAAEEGDRLDHAHQGGVACDQAVDARGGPVVGRFERRPLQAHREEQDDEDQRGDGDRDQRREAVRPDRDVHA